MEYWYIILPHVTSCIGIMFLTSLSVSPVIKKSSAYMYTYNKILQLFRFFGGWGGSKLELLVLIKYSTKQNNPPLSAAQNLRKRCMHM